MNIFEVIVNPPSEISIDVETTGLERHDKIVTAAIAWSNQEAEALWMYGNSTRARRSQKIFRKLLSATLFNPNYKGTVIFHNLSFDMLMIFLAFKPLERFSEITICRVFDTMAASRVLRNNKLESHASPDKLKPHGLKYLVKEHFDENHTSFENILNGKNILEVDQKKVLEYNKKDALYTWRLRQHFKSIAARDEWFYIEQIEMPFILSIFHINWHGIPFDLDKANELQDRLTDFKFSIEKNIFKGIGRSFNVGSHRDLRRALFYNGNITYKGFDGISRPIYPPGETENEQSKVDLSTLSEIKAEIEKSDSKSPTITTLNYIMQWTEIEKTIAWINSCTRVAVRAPEGFKIYPQLKADAKSGRVTCKKPALIAMPKLVFSKSDTTDFTPAQSDLIDMSIKKLFAIDSPNICKSVDISGLDLTVIAHLAKKYNKDFPWVEFMLKGGSIDTHMCIFQSIEFDKFMDVYSAGKIVPDQLAKILKEHFPLKISDDKKKIEFIERKGSGLFELYGQDDEAHKLTIISVKKIRGTWKVVNLSIPYLTGPVKLALKFKKDTGENMSVLEAQRLLTKFKEGVPEVGLSQDWIANKIYKVGCEKSIFGRRFYADVFDELNEYYWSCRRQRQKGLYKFICFFDGDYWYVEASDWLKAGSNLVKGLKVTDKSAVLRFSRIDCAVRLNKFIFRKPDIVRKKSKFSRKTEDDQDELSNYKLTRIQITNEIEHALKLGTSISLEAKEIFSNLICDGHYFLPERNVIFYQVPTKSPSSKYFRFYKPLDKVARKFYPVFCQGVANTLAQMVLTEIRREIEKLDPKVWGASILLFIHDQIDTMVNEGMAGQMEILLLSCVKSIKAGFRRRFDITLSGELKESVHHLPVK